MTHPESLDADKNSPFPPQSPSTPTRVMSPTITIRPARVEEGERMRQCSFDVFPAETQPIEYYNRILSLYPGLPHVAVTDEDKIVGICLIKIKDDVKDATHAHVSALCVLAAYREQGIARRLLTTSLHAAKERFGVSLVTLHARKSNEPAIKLYTSLKFYTTVTKPGHYHDGEDGLAMNLVFNNDADT